RGERIDPRWVAYLISSADLEGFEPPPWLAVLRPALVGAYSADNMDYVPRDSYICGVSAGPVDVQRIIHYSFISERGLTLHAHAAEALYMFLNSRLYLYHQVYFHRTVRRIDLQLREVFRPTVDLLLGGNPLERLDRYLSLTEWSLLSDVDRWSRGDGDGQRRELGQAWADGAVPDLRPRRNAPARADPGGQRGARAYRLEVVTVSAEVVSTAEIVVPAAVVITAPLSVALARAHGGERRDQPAQRGLAAVGAWRIGRGIAHQQRRRPLAT